MIMVNTHQAKTNLSKLLTLVSEKHETVRICRNGKPVAVLQEITQDTQMDPLKKHPELLGVVFHENPTAGIPAEFYPDYSEGK